MRNGIGQRGDLVDLEAHPAGSRRTRPGATSPATADLGVISVYLTRSSLLLFLVGGVIVGAGALFKAVVATIVSVSPPERRAETLTGMFLTGYVGLTVPVVALGIMTQSLSPRLSLLIFAAALAARDGAGGATAARADGRRLIGGLAASLSHVTRGRRRRSLQSCAVRGSMS